MKNLKKIFIYLKCHFEMPITFLFPGASSSHLAAQLGHIDVVQTLLHHGADIHTKSNIGKI